jgi:WD40 repeat protein
MKIHIKTTLFLAILFFLAASSPAQIIYFPYYGKNKVLYEKFDWNHYKTEHFDVYYYSKDTKVLKTIAELAESAYKELSQTLKHELSSPIPLLYYRTFTDFQQTNLFYIPEGVLGVAEPLLYRVALHGDMALDELHKLIKHELTHVFEFDLLWGSPGGSIYNLSQPAGWIMEGFSEYNTGVWSSWSSLIVRDAVLNDRIPELNKGGALYSRYPLPRPPDYDFGHAIYDFIEAKYGKVGVREFWQSLKNAPMIGRQNPIERAFDMTVKEFNYEFKKHIRAKHKDFMLRENPEDYSLALGPEFPLNPYYFSFSHTLSPSGDIVAALLVNLKDADYDIMLISTKDGSIIKNITKGYTLKYEFIKYEIDPAKGKDIAWSSDGDRIAFFGRAGQKHSLFIINAMSGKVLQEIKIPHDQPASPCFLPDGGELFFTAFDNGIHDIFKVNLATQKILNLTNDASFEKAPAISPDGQAIAYTVRIDTYDKLFLSPLNDLTNKMQLTFGKSNTITPEFSKDSKSLFFSGDSRGAYNIYSLDLETGDLRRLTDVRTGNFFPIPFPDNPKQVVFSSFNKGAFQIFKGELEGEVEKTIAFAEKSTDEEVKQFEPIITLNINEEKIQAYKGMGRLYLTARPPIDTIVSTDGSIYGGSAISFSDLMGDHSFYLSIYQVQSFRSYYLSYINQVRRLQFMASAYHYTLFYYPPFSYYDPYLYRVLSYRDATATRKITGASVMAYYPFSRYFRAESSLSYSNYEEDFYDPYMNQLLYYYGNTYNQFWNGHLLAASFALVGETTRFKYYGPASGNTFRLSLSQSLPVSDAFFKNTTVTADLRQYLYIGADSLFAFRFKGFASMGEDRYVSYWGGNNEVRSAHYYSIIANEGWFANLEFRFPLVNAASTIIGQIGPVRATLFADVTRAKLEGYEANFFIYLGESAGGPAYRVADAIGSYGFGFQFFFLGLPIHLEFAKRLEIEDFSKPWDVAGYGHFETKFWIGFDF